MQRGPQLAKEMDFFEAMMSDTKPKTAPTALIRQQSASSKMPNRPKPLSRTKTVPQAHSSTTNPLLDISDDENGRIVLQDAERAGVHPGFPAMQQHSFARSSITEVQTVSPKVNVGSQKTEVVKAAVAKFEVVDVVETDPEDYDGDGSDSEFGELTVVDPVPIEDY
jgi:hypothetical protein